MSSSLRANDVAARVGGDEFAVLLPESNTKAARAVVRRLLERLREIQTGDGELLGVSVGLACFLRPPDSIKQMIKKADRLMFMIEKTGKNHIMCSEFDGEREVLGEALLEHEMGLYSNN